MRKNKKIKVASAKDIYDYLAKSAVDGIAMKTKRDVSNHFGYKTSNGAGFLANFKILITNGLIEDISEKGQNGVWRVNSCDKFKFPDKNQTKGVNMKKLVGVKLNCLEPIDFEGKKYIPLSNLANALNVSISAVHNVCSKKNKSTYEFMKNIPLESKTVKSVDIEGLSYVFDKLQKKVSPSMLDGVLTYVSNTYGIDNNQSVTLREVCVTNIDSVEEEVVSLEQSSLLDDSRYDCNSSAKESVILMDDVNIENLDSSIQNMINVLDGYEKMLTDSSQMVSQINSMEKEILLLKTQNSVLAGKNEKLNVLNLKLINDISDLCEKMARISKAFSDKMPIAN